MTAKTTVVYLFILNFKHPILPSAILIAGYDRNNLAIAHKKMLQYLVDIAKQQD